MDCVVFGGSLGFLLLCFHRRRGISTCCCGRLLVSAARARIMGVKQCQNPIDQTWNQHDEKQNANGQTSSGIFGDDDQENKAQGCDTHKTSLQGHVDRCISEPNALLLALTVVLTREGRRVAAPLYNLREHEHDKESCQDYEGCMGKENHDYHDK
jgi:hypothetical protein